MSKLSFREHAQRYLEKHTVIAEHFGAGKLIDEGKMRIIGNMEYAREGLMLIRTLGGPFTDCAITSYRLWQDIQQNHPYMKPDIAAGSEGSIHFWVEIKDERGRTIQIDPTPWYCRLDPGHRKVRVVAPHTLVSNENFYAIEENRGLNVSTRKVGDEFITTTLRGCWPRAIQFGEQLERDPEAGYGVADLRLILMIRKSLGPLSSGKMAPVPIQFDLIDNSCIQHLNLIDLDIFMRTGWVELGTNFSNQTYVFSSLQEAEQLVKSLLGNEAIEELKKNLQRIMKLLKDTANG